MKFLDFYIRSSLHVSVSVALLTCITYHLSAIYSDFSVLFFVFFSTVVGYNYTKYSNVLFQKNASSEMLKINILTFISAIFSLCFFLTLRLESQFLIIGLGILTLFYVLDFFNHKNLRNQSGLKIYIVAFCWVGTTFLLPIMEAKYLINFNVLIMGFQRFLFVLILILVFEIIDLKKDAPTLKTIPQTIGVKNTKILGIVLLSLFFGSEFLLLNDKKYLLINGILSFTTFLFVIFANENRSKYYTTFWVESLPILWFFLVKSCES